MTWRTVDPKLSLIQRCDKLTKKCEKCFNHQVTISLYSHSSVFAIFFTSVQLQIFDLVYKDYLHWTSIICSVFETYLFPTVVKRNHIQKLSPRTILFTIDWSVFQLLGELSAVNRRKKESIVLKNNILSFNESILFFKLTLTINGYWTGFKWNTLNVNESGNSA